MVDENTNESQSINQFQDSFNAFLPPEMAKKAELIGMQKAELPASKMFALAVLAGAFIAFGAVFSTTVTAGAEQLPPGVTRLLGGVTFSLGLVLVVVAGAELFTGNNLLVMALAGGKISLQQMLRCWGIVYLGNFAGSIVVAGFMLLSSQHDQGNGVIHQKAIELAVSKCNIAFLNAFFLGVLCNSLVCLAIWLCYSARSTTDKVFSILFPVTAFVASGFEHCVANMYFIPMGLFLKASMPESSTLIQNPSDLEKLTWSNFIIWNLVPVSLGNIAGGALCVGIVYWFIYLRETRQPSSN